MRILYAILLLLVSGNVLAQSSLNLAIPQTPQSFQQDRIRAGDLECSAAIGSSTNVEFGVVGILNQNDPFSQNQFLIDPATGQYSDRFVRDVGVYGRINIPIGAPKERLNCNLLYKLELERRKLEVMKLQQEIAQLRRLQFEE
jgi:hypothetical protein